MTIRIVCITKQTQDETNSPLSITELGGVNEQTGNLQFYRREELYEIVKKEGNHVYINDILGNKLKIMADVSASGEKYVRASLNDDRVDDILKLSSCKTLK